MYIHYSLLRKLASYKVCLCFIVLLCCIVLDCIVLYNIVVTFVEFFVDLVKLLIHDNYSLEGSVSISTCNWHNQRVTKAYLKFM